jgi:hypothetical protein
MLFGLSSWQTSSLYELFLEWTKPPSTPTLMNKISVRYHNVWPEPFEPVDGFYETWHDYHVVRNQLFLYFPVSCNPNIAVLRLFKAQVPLAWQYEIMYTITVYCISGKGPLKTQREASSFVVQYKLFVLLSFPITYLLTYGAEPFLRSCQLCSHSENSQQSLSP